MSPDDLDASPKDRGADLAKTLSSVLPGVGPFIAQILLNDLPGLRIDRVVDFIRRLAKRVDALEFGQKLRNEASIDLVEEGAHQSTRALSEERREHIAALVAFGLSGEEVERIEAKRLLALLSSIDDDQIIMLAAKLHRYQQDEMFHTNHAKILMPYPTHMQSTREELDAAEIADLARSQLVSLGLLRIRFKTPRSGTLPEFDDKTGMIKAQGNELTSLARLLLRRIGLAEEDEF